MSDTQGSMISDDTPENVRDIYFRRLAEMTPTERVNIGVALSQAADSLQRAAISRRYPAADESELVYRIAVSRFGEQLAHKAYRIQ